MSASWRPPQRPRGEGGATARKRWKETGRCQKYGRKMKGRGRLRGACAARANKGYGPGVRDRRRVPGGDRRDAWTAVP